MNKKLLLILCCICWLAAGAFFDKPLPFIVTGQVINEKNKPLADVTVAEIGTNNKVKTDAKGNFSITINHLEAKLRFSYIGYNLQEIKIKSSTNLNIVLKPTSNALNEVVVAGAHSSLIRSNIVSSGSLMAPPNQESKQIYSGNFDNQPSEALPDSREGYDGIVENRFRKALDNPLSTFSIDVDGASYSNLRRFINNGSLPPAGAVRIEEMINYFHYGYPQPTGDDPFSISTELGICPWNSKHQLALIGLQGRKIDVAKLPPSNLVFLIDVSGSMDEPSKLPLVKSSLKLLAEQLRGNDRVAIVVYAGSAGLVLPPTNGSDKKTINMAIDNLNSGGSTAGGEGIRLAYKTAKEYFRAEGNNRVILCTDGDFNVGESSDDAMERLIEKERESGIYLSVLGFGMGNYQDAKLQKLADKGNGNHHYINDISEAKKVLVSEFGGTLFTIAKDVKLQVEFNPGIVQGYRLIGYENRMLQKEDFNNDGKDAGELGSGHAVTALYEIIPTGIIDEMLENVDDLKYQTPGKTVAVSNELMTIKFRFKKPDDNISKLIVHTVAYNSGGNETTENLRFASAIAEFGMLLRNSNFKQNASYKQVLNNAKSATGKDADGYRNEFVTLVERAAQLLKKDTGDDSEPN